VNDPQVAEKLIPKDHGFGTRRVPLETNYFESYNQDNVELIDLNETPIERIVENGILTTEKEIEFDLIIFATGFDAVFGSYNKIDIQGVDGLSLTDQWKEELATFLGIQNHGFPNMYMIMGPHAMQGNNPRNIEFNVQWITDLIKRMNERGLTRAEASLDSQNGWHDYVLEQGEDLLLTQVDSWFTGINSNIEGRQTRITAIYRGSMQSFRSRCEEVAQNGYKELDLR
jgi:cation diffusion facilitator CzcD-associated flavoprotein CzcO